MYQIAIVGAGQIGSRHLQALSMLDLPFRLWVVDPSQANLATARERFEQCTKSCFVQSVDYCPGIERLPRQLDVVIVATGANVRRAVIEALLSHATVRYLVLEKVLFQKVDDLAAVEGLLKENHVEAWVNCPFRMVPFYAQLKEKFGGDRKVDYAVTGSLIGIGCNAIHYLDMCAYFSGDMRFDLSPGLLDPHIIQSKRSGFVELTGTLTGLSTRGSRFAITSYAAGCAPVLITIASSALRCIIRENEGRCWIAEADRGWTWREEQFEIPYQSQLSHRALHSILVDGRCALTTFAESALLHESLLTAFTNHLLQHGALQEGACPIT